MPSYAHAEHYAKVIRDLAGKRNLIRIANDLLRRGYDPGDDGNVPRHGLWKLCPRRWAPGAADDWKLADKTSEAYDQLGTGGVPMVPTGIVCLDNATGGIGLGENIIVGARPSMGKSMIGKQIWVNAGALEFRPG